MKHAYSMLMTVAIASACSMASADDTIGLLSVNSQTWDRPTATGAVITGSCNATAQDSANDGVAYELFYIRTGVTSPTLDIQVDSIEATPLDLDPFIAVYCDSFDPLFPNANLLHVDDDSAGYPNALAVNTVALDPDTLYIAVVSSYSNYPQSQFGKFRITLGTDLFFSSLCISDLNGDGFLDFLDISVFLGAFTSNDPAADLNFDGNLDFLDISLFLGEFGAGCP